MGSRPSVTDLLQQWQQQTTKPAKSVCNQPQTESALGSRGIVLHRKHVAFVHRLEGVEFALKDLSAHLRPEHHDKLPSTACGD